MFTITGILLMALGVFAVKRSIVCDLSDWDLLEYILGVIGFIVGLTVFIYGVLPIFTLIN